MRFSYLNVFVIVCMFNMICFLYAPKPDVMLMLEQHDFIYLSACWLNETLAVCLTASTILVRGNKCSNLRVSFSLSGKTYRVMKSFS